MDWILGIVIIIVFAVILLATWKDMKAEWEKEDADDAAFEQRRARRQAEFDRHWQEVCHAELMDTCETIYIGRWQNE